MATTIQTDSLTALDGFAIGLTATTGLVHLRLFFKMPSTVLGISWLLAGLGFFGAIVLAVLGYRRRLLYLAGIPYTGAQIILYFYLNNPPLPLLMTTAFVDKTIQLVLLIIFLILPFQRS